MATKLIAVENVMAMPPAIIPPWNLPMRAFVSRTILFIAVFSWSPLTESAAPVTDSRQLSSKTAEWNENQAELPSTETGRQQSDIFRENEINADQRELRAYLRAIDNHLSLLTFLSGGVSVIAIALIIYLDFATRRKDHADLRAWYENEEQRLITGLKSDIEERIGAIETRLANDTGGILRILRQDHGNRADANGELLHQVATLLAADEEKRSRHAGEINGRLNEIKEMLDDSRGFNHREPSVKPVTGELPVPTGSGYVPASSNTFREWRSRYLAALAGKDYRYALFCVNKQRELGFEEWEKLSANISLVLVSTILDGFSKANISLFDEVIKTHSQSRDPLIMEQVARAFFGKGWILYGIGQKQAAVLVYDELDSRYGRHTETGIVEQVGKSLNNKGLVLSELGLKRAAIAVYDEVVERYAHYRDVTIIEQVARALFNKGVNHTDINEKQAAIAAYDEAFKRYADYDSLPIAELLARALFNKGILLAESEQKEEAIAVYNELDERYGRREEAAIAERVAKSLNNKGQALYELGDPESAVGISDCVVERYGHRDETGIIEQVVMSLLNKGLSLSDMGRTKAAITVYEEAVRRYGKRAEPDIVELINNAKTWARDLRKKHGAAP
jgi:tetratricopeptide (TPR) repeat protein